MFFDSRSSESEAVNSAFGLNHAVNAHRAISLLAGGNGWPGALRGPQAASRHSYRWWRPPNRGMAMTLASSDGLA